MIARLHGIVVAREDGMLVVDVGGVGYGVRVPASFLAGVNIGEEVALHTHLVVREDALSLYGFPSQAELQVFGLLIAVSGIGPRLALSILSAMTPSSLRAAIGNEQPELLSRIPGVGAKTARKLILELKDKIGAGDGVVEAVASLSAADAEVIEALTGLGYSIVEAQRAVQSVPPGVGNVEERLRLALTFFSR